MEINFTLSKEIKKFFFNEKEIKKLKSHFLQK